MRRYRWLLAAAGMILTACAGLSGPQTAAAPAVLPAAPTPAPSAAPTGAPTLTPSPVPFGSAPVPTELPALDPSSPADLRGLIVFRSTEMLPFAFPPESAGGLDRFGSPQYAYLWGVSPDGMRAGRLSPDHHDFALALPAYQKPLFVTDGFTIDHPLIEPVIPPDLCAVDGQRCDQFALSPDGRYLGFRYGPDVCGRPMQVIDRQTGAVAYQDEGRVHFFSFLSSSVISVSAGHCEGSFTTFHDLATGEIVPGGGSGALVWNPDRSVFVMAETEYTGPYSAYWGYRLDEGASFRPELREASASPMDSGAVFLPDGQRFLYQHIDYTQDAARPLLLFGAPSQIVRYDPRTGERAVLAADPAYHFRLCQSDPAGGCPTGWRGGWLAVERLPFAPVSVDLYDWPASPQINCLLYGSACPPESELLALNAETGELRPWDPARLPAPAPTPTPARGPDFSKTPIYLDPGGAFAFYTGLDGGSLWRVPLQGGEPELWVKSGQGFLYLPE